MQVLKSLAKQLFTLTIANANTRYFHFNENKQKIQNTKFMFFMLSTVNLPPQISMVTYRDW